MTLSRNCKKYAQNIMGRILKSTFHINFLSSIFLGLGVLGGSENDVGLVKDFSTSVSIVFAFFSIIYSMVSMALQISKCSKVEQEEDFRTIC
jgi:hypothetical protein